VAMLATIDDHIPPDTEARSDVRYALVDTPNVPSPITRGLVRVISTVVVLVRPSHFPSVKRATSVGAGHATGVAIRNEHEPTDRLVVA